MSLWPRRSACCWPPPFSPPRRRPAERAIPPEPGFRAAEVSPSGDPRALLRANPELCGLPLLMNSDAHYLENMPDPAAWIDLPEASPEALIAFLNGGLSAPWYRPGRSEDGLSWL